MTPYSWVFRVFRASGQPLAGRLGLATVVGMQRQDQDGRCGQMALAAAVAWSTLSGEDGR